MSVKLRVLAGLVMLGWGIAANSATMDITASFVPSMDNPESNTFTNTTPQGGYCAIWPSYCTNGVFSITLPLELTRSFSIMANAAPRNGIYYKIPSGWRNVSVRNMEDNTSVVVKFRANIFSARYIYSGSNSTWDGGVHLGSGRAPCSTAATPVGAGGSRPWMHFAWRYPDGDSACYRISTVDRDDKGDNYLNPINNMSVGYEIVTPNPLQMNSGVYKGTLSLNVGPGGDFDFGDNYQASDSNLNINFTLSVNHELKLSTTAEDQKVTLQPCAVGRICTEDEGKANWERWMITRLTPRLTGRSSFSLSSSGAFTVYLQCEQQSDGNCALKSDNTSQRVPVQTLLTLPDNIVDATTGSMVLRRPLATEKNLSHNVFRTKSFGQDRKGSIDFLVSQRDVDTMLRSRPDTYRGAVTVIFDPQVY